MSFDFSTLDARAGSTEGRWMTIKSPATGKPIVSEDGTSPRLLLLGPDAPGYRAAQSRAMRRMLDRRTLAGDEADESMDPAADLSDKARFVAEITLAAEGVTVDGVPLVHSQASVDALEAFLNRFPFVADQADIFVGSRRNFLASSATV